ncbi:DUF3467 domain-containing protein [Methanosalsum natronophilum]|uniref:DUF3467 domain-containing protein n=2 Tax=Methanosalsum natronophilum TaxID=768733 RepID=A0A424YS80_9EURY|nr:MAG: DUF3467 domain-containing protein [Methanosalsum natronophilum]
MKEKRRISIEIQQSEQFRQIYAIGAVGGHTPYDIRIGFYNDIPQTIGSQKQKHSMRRQIETEIILSPLAALELSGWLKQHLQEYERKFGPITRPRKQNISEKQIEDSSNLQGYI